MKRFQFIIGRNRLHRQTVGFHPLPGIPEQALRRRHTGLGKHLFLHGFRRDEKRRFLSDLFNGRRFKVIIMIMRNKHDIRIVNGFSELIGIEIQNLRSRDPNAALSVYGDVIQVHFYPASCFRFLSHVLYRLTPAPTFSCTVSSHSRLSYR